MLILYIYICTWKSKYFRNAFARIILLICFKNNFKIIIRRYLYKYRGGFVVNYIHKIARIRTVE